jgi:hypothetical protein
MPGHSIQLPGRLEAAMAARLAIALSLLLVSSAGHVDAAVRSEASNSAKGLSAKSLSVRSTSPTSPSQKPSAQRSTEPAAETPLTRGALVRAPDGRSAEESWSWARDFHADPRGM